eukprot:6173466-Pleurochrysis_carterae.AAC.4
MLGSLAWRGCVQLRVAVHSATWYGRQYQCCGLPKSFPYAPRPCAAQPELRAASCGAQRRVHILSKPERALHPDVAHAAQMCAIPTARVRLLKRRSSERAHRAAAICSSSLACPYSCGRHTAHLSVVLGIATATMAPTHATPQTARVHCCSSRSTPVGVD